MSLIINNTSEPFPFLLSLAIAIQLSLAPIDALGQTDDSTGLPGTRFAVASPDKKFELVVSLGADGRPLYHVKRSGRDVVRPSGLGLELKGREGDGMRGFGSLELVEQGEHDVTWSPVWGERSTVRDRYRRALVRFRRQSPPAVLNVEFRVYDAGVALRYVVDAHPDDDGKVTERGDAAAGNNGDGDHASGDNAGGDEIEIVSEHTEFRFTADHQLWAVTSAQGKYTKVRLSELEHTVERPCVLETADGQVIAIAEAALVDYARMRLRRVDNEAHALVSALHKSKGNPVVSQLPLMTPWRVVMAADTAGELLEQNDLLLNLNQPCAIADTSWIKPGKAIREVTLSTDGGKACVDFAVEYGLQFIEFDAGWYGDQQDEQSDARTVSRRDLDLPAVIQYAKERGIGVLLYVNRRHLEQQLDELLPLYKEWGIAGIKFGFVQHGSQEWTAWMHDAIRKAAEHGLMVDVHDEYRMTGWQRTYPNFMTAEGIGGDETRPTNEQALANLFTRMIAGPADHTFCYYNGYVDQTTSHASQLAKGVCFFSPWQFLFWYDRPSAAQGEPELEFYRHLPTTWDDTQVLAGKIGQFAIIARRKGNDWFIGCLNAGEARTLEFPLDFLSAGVDFEAHIYRDDVTVGTRTKVGIERRVVNSRQVLKAVMSDRGGMAVRLVRKDAGK